MEEWGKVIDQFTVEYAPINYENISNFNLDKALMWKYGFRPIQIINTPNDIKYPKLTYELVEDKYINGKWINYPPTVEELRVTIKNNIVGIYNELKARYLLYVDKYRVAFNRYTIEELNAYVISQEEQPIQTIDGKYVIFNQKQLLKLLQDKLKTNSGFLLDYKKAQDEADAAQTLEDLESIKCKCPVTYYHFQDLGNVHIGNETLLDDSTMKCPNAINISIYHSDETRVYYGKLGLNGKDYLDEHHIPAIPLNYNAGTIVGLKGDLNLTCTSMDPALNTIIVDALRQAIENLGYNATIDNNDILIDNKKCIGCSDFVTFDQKTMFHTMYIHISFHINNELIDIVRVKPKIKECTGLNIVNPNITQEDVINEFYKTMGQTVYRRFECQE